VPLPGPTFRLQYTLPALFFRAFARYIGAAGSLATEINGIAITVRTPAAPGASTEARQLEQKPPFHSILICLMVGQLPEFPPSAATAADLDPPPG
jgi:hypothetical protein